MGGWKGEGGGAGGGGEVSLLLPAVSLVAELEAEFLGEAACLGNTAEVTSRPTEPEDICTQVQLLASQFVW